MKWVSKKCGLFAVLLALLFTALFTGYSASAVSPYDNIVQPVNALNTKCLSNGSNLTDWTTSWAYFLLNQEVDPRSGDETFINNARNLYRSNLELGSGWFVFQEDEYRIGIAIYDPNEVTPEFVTDPSDTQAPNIPQLRFSGANYGDNFLTLSIVDFGQYGFSCGDFQLVAPAGAYNHFRSGYQFNVFLLADDITYPTGYEGEQIPQTYAPPRKPDFNYTVSSSGLLKVDYLDNHETKPDGAFEVQLAETTEEWQSPLNVLDERSISPAYAMGYEYQLPKSGYYHVGIFYEDEAELDGVALQFYWNGFSAINGTTVGGCYDDDGVCNPELLATHPIVRLLNSLPVNDFGLQELVRAPIQFLSSLPARAENCSPITLNLPYANAPVTFPCLTTTVFRPHFPTLLTIWQTVITGIVAYAISIRIFATVKNVQTPDNDRIEVAKL